MIKVIKKVKASTASNIKHKYVCGCCGHTWDKPEKEAACCII